MIFICSTIVLITSILTGIILSKFLPQRTTENLELQLLDDNDNNCSLEKACENLQIANKLLNKEHLMI